MRINLGNYGNGQANSMFVEIGNLTLYFSYKTVIGFEGFGEPLTVSENLWGPTTGKHLNLLQSDKDKRLARRVFEDRLNHLLSEHGLSI
jgi:hypothetical protein